MGLYVEPEDMAKIEWCIENGIPLEVDEKITFADIPRDYMAVCCVDNVFFIALAVAYDAREFKYFIENVDERPKRWFLVPRDIVRDNCPAWYDYVNEERPKWYQRIKWVEMGKKSLKFLLPPAFLIGLIVLFIMFAIEYKSDAMGIVILFFMMYGLDNVLLDWSPTWKKLRK